MPPLPPLADEEFEVPDDEQPGTERPVEQPELEQKQQLN